MNGASTVVKGELPPTKDEDRRLTTGVIDLTLPPPAEDDGMDVEIVVESVETLIKPISKSMKAYAGVERIGDPHDQDLPIFMSRKARDRAHEAAHSARGRKRWAASCWAISSTTRLGQLFVDVAEVVVADQAKGTYVSINFDHAAWRQVFDRLDRDFRAWSCWAGCTPIW